FVRELVEHRMICAAVTELHLVGFPADSQTQDLVAEADPEDGDFAEETLYIPDLYAQRLRIARTVGQEHAIRLQIQYIFGGGERGHDGDAAAHLNQPTQDIVLYAEIVS